MEVTKLTKHIVEGLLGEEAKKDVLVYAGSFRPPTKSDYNLLLKAIEKNPGVDEIHVFVGDAESEGLNQDDSVEIFKMFGEHFPRDFYVHKSEESPVSDVYAYASKFPTYDIDWLFGVREGNSDDFKQVADRTKSVRKYDNVSISPVVYDKKATEREVGAAANMGKDELAKYMPNNLTYKELDDIYNMLKPKQLDEAMHQYTDDIINKIAEEGWEYYDTGDLNLPGKAAKVAKQARKENKKLFTLAYERDSSSDPVIQYINVFWADGGNPRRDVIEGGTMQDYEDIRDAGQLYLQEVDTDDLAKFDQVIEKIVDGGYTYLHISGAEKWMGEEVHKYLRWRGKKDNKKYFYIRDNGQDILMFFPDDERYPLGGISDDDLNDIIQAGSLNEVATADLAKYETVVDKIAEEGYEYFPAEDLPFNGLKTGLMLNASKQNKKLFTITQNVSGGGMWNPDTPKQYSTSVYLATPDSTEVETSVIHNTTKEDLEDLLGAAGESLDTVLKESVEFEYDPVHGLDHYEDLMRYMSKNGLNIEPFPEIKFVDDDADNAEDLFGKTAYYDPNNKSVVLYTYGRHPKDIMRSFAHELVHVHQDNEGRIGNIQTTNTNEDDDLVELEKEAYLKGNILFRQWTDSLNEKKKEYGINAYAAELARLREHAEVSKTDFANYLRKTFLNG